MSAGATLREAAPDLSDPRLYKGAAGRIAIVGGSREYTGAPYYAAMAALRGGAELATVYCHADAAPAIKAYSPGTLLPRLVQIILSERRAAKVYGTV